MANIYDHCNTEELAEAFGRALTADELTMLSEEILKTAHVRLARSLDNTLDDAIENGVADAIITVQGRVADKKRQAAHNLSAVSSAINNIRENWSGDFSGEGYKALVIGSPFRKKGAKLSVAAEQEYAVGRNRGRFNSDLTLHDPDGRLRGRFVKGELDMEIRRAGAALDDVDGAADILGDIDPDAVAMARILMRHEEQSRLKLNEAGANIERLPGRVTKQAHSTTHITHAKRSMTKAGKSFIGESDEDVWVEYMMENLDLDMSFKEGPGNMTVITNGLKDSFQSLSRGEHLQTKVSRGAGKVAVGLEQERVFFFKNGVEGEIEYSEIFGGWSKVEVPLGLISNSAFI